MKDIHKTIMQKSRQVIIYFLFFCIMVGIIWNKKNLHGDEVLSYSLANNIGTYMMRFEEGYTYRPAEKLYLDCMTVNAENGRFNFQNVWNNQAQDVHPPFYYILLHIICSFFPVTFSVWYAAAINIVFAMLTLYILRKLMHLFMKNDVLVDICSVMFSMSIGVLQNVSFLRMYVMAMFWVTLTTWLFLRAFEERNSEKIVWERWIYIGLTAVAGAMTHYYCLVYLFFICMIFGLFSLVEKKWKNILALFISMALAALDSVYLFPAMLVHMFSGYRGTESMSNLTGITWKEYWERLTVFFSYLDSQLFGKLSGIAAIVFLILFLYSRKNKKTEMLQSYGDKWMKWFIVTAPSFLYFLVVSKAAIYVTDRYLFPIYAVVFCSYFSGMILIGKRILNVGKKLYAAAGIICLIFTASSWINVQWYYMFQSSVNLLNKAQEYQNLNCICIYEGIDDGGYWKAQNMFYEVSNYESITFIHKNHIKNITQYKDLLKDEFILTIIGADAEETLQEIQDCHPSFKNQENIGGYAYSVTYHIFQ